VKKNSRIFPAGRTFLLATLALACAAPLAAAELHVRGLGWFGNRTAEQRLKLLLGDKIGANLDANILEDAALVLISGLTDEGYLQPGLTAEATLTDGRQVSYPLDARLEQPLPRPLAATAATLRIARGQRFTLRDIRFTGLTAVTEKKARALFVGEGRLIPLASERIYSPGRLRRSLGNLTELLHQLGYAEAAVTAPEPGIDVTTGRVQLRVVVQEGRQWLVTGMQYVIADGSAAPDGLIEGRLGRPWNSFWRQDAATAIRRWYYVRGHPDVQVALTPQNTAQADGTMAVDVLARIAPGPEVKVGAVRFTGNRYTREATLRRFVRSTPGERLNPIKFNRSQARISRLGVFRAVDLRYEPVDGATRNVVYALTEGRRQEISLMAGYGSYEQLRGGVEWRHYNLFGRAHISSLKLVQSMKSSQGDFTHTVPELLGSPLDGSARLFVSNRQEPSFRHEEYGANVSLLWPVRRYGVALTTGYTYRHLRDTANELATSTTDLAQADVGSINVGLVQDRRDNPLRPRRGYKVSFQTEWADHAFGGEVAYQQAILAGSYHTGWGDGRWIHLGLAHGVVTTFGAPDDSALPVSVRFFPGGDGSIRGYPQGEAAPRAANGLFVGAKSYVQVNLELEQALTSNWSVVVFVDALGTAARLADYPFSEKLYSVGLGLRYQTIIGPVRLEYGHNLNPRPLDPSGSVQLSIGFPF
jgi:outer membrane protein assembly complex protein YaeT